MVTNITPQLIIQALLLGLLVGGVYALMSSGLTLVFGIMKVINIAQGAFLVLSAYVSYVLYSNWQIDPLLSVVVTVPMMFGIGAVFYSGVIKRLTTEFSAFTVLVTFALAITIEGILGTIFGGDFVSARPAYARGSITLGDYYYIPVSRLITFIFAALTLITLYWLMSRSKLGRSIRATIQNRSAAQLVGVDVERVTAITFAIGVATAGVGGSLLTLLTTFYPASHLLWISRLLAIIVLGGMGSLPGAVVGALILGGAESIAAVTISLSWSPIVFYILLLIILLLRPQGLLGTLSRRDV